MPPSNGTQQRLPATPYPAPHEWYPISRSNQRDLSDFPIEKTDFVVRGSHTASLALLVLCKYSLPVWADTPGGDLYSIAAATCLSWAPDATICYLLVLLDSRVTVSSFCSMAIFGPKCHPVPVVCLDWISHTWASLLQTTANHTNHYPIMIYIYIFFSILHIFVPWRNHSISQQSIWLECMTQNQHAKKCLALWRSSFTESVALLLSEAANPFEDGKTFYTDSRNPCERIILTACKVDTQLHAIKSAKECTEPRQGHIFSNNMVIYLCLIPTRSAEYPHWTRTWAKRMDESWRQGMCNRGTDWTNKAATKPPMKRFDNNPDQACFRRPTEKHKKWTKKRSRMSLFIHHFPVSFQKSVSGKRERDEENKENEEHEENDNDDDAMTMMMTMTMTTTMTTRWWWWWWWWLLLLLVLLLCK